MDELYLLLPFLSLLCLIIVVLLPLIPAVLIYKFFPNISIVATGRIGSNITWNTSGAFAGYLIVLFTIIFTPLFKHLVSSVSKGYPIVWTVKVNELEHKVTNVEFQPRLHDYRTKRAILKIPRQYGEEFPELTLQVAGGSTILDISQLSDNEKEVDGFTININKPIKFNIPKAKYEYSQSYNNYLQEYNQ